MNKICKIEQEILITRFNPFRKVLKEDDTVCESDVVRLATQIEQLQEVFGRKLHSEYIFAE